MATRDVSSTTLDGFSDAEVEAGRTGFLQQLVLSRSSDTGLASLLGNNRYLGRTTDYLVEFEQAIEALSTEDVNAALRRHLDPEGFTIVVAGDFDESE